jgi:hypothetical protein
VGEHRRAHVAVLLDPLRLDDAVVLEQATRRERLEVPEPARRQRAIDAVTRVENPALRVAE